MEFSDANRLIEVAYDSKLCVVQGLGRAGSKDVRVESAVVIEIRRATLAERAGLAEGALGNGGPLAWSL